MKTILFIILSALLISCSKSKVDQESHEMLTFQDALGHEIKLSKVPERIVSVAPSLTEIVCAVGSEDKLVAVTRFSDFPPSVKTLPKVGTYAHPSVEKIISMNPDLILVVYDGPPKSSVDKLRELGQQVAVLKSTAFNDITNNIRWISKVMQNADKGESIASDLEKKYSAIKTLGSKNKKPKALYSIAIKPVVTIGNSSHIHELLQDAGAMNIYSDIEQAYPKVSLESVIERAPEIIIYGDEAMGTEAGKKAQTEYWKTWDGIPAVKNDRLATINPDSIVRPGPRIVEGLARLAVRIHPELEKEIRAIQDF